eukprot:1814195-Pleurochrysis_carterae.AAC.1
MYFYHQRNPCRSLCLLLSPRLVMVRTCSSAVHLPRDGHTVVSSASQAQPQQIDYPRVTTAKLREALDKQGAKREKNQSIVSYAMDSLNAFG